jgi:hypothetical protein
MTVIVKRLKTNSMEVFCKGAPECMPDVCDPSTFPHDYEDMLSYYTRNGFRVIAIAGKSIENLTWLKAQRMKREVAESNLHFLGFIVFENKLKPGTAPNIHTRVITSGRQSLSLENVDWYHIPLVSISLLSSLELATRRMLNSIGRVWMTISRN